MKVIMLGIIALLLLFIFLQHKKICASKNILTSVNAMRDILYCIDLTPTFKYRYLSTSINEQMGKGSYELHMKNPNIVFDIVHPDDLQILEKKARGELDFTQPIVVRLKNMNGEYVWFEDLATPIIKNGVCIGVIGVYRRIDNYMKKLQEIEYAVSHDKLTNVYNRSYFETMMTHYNEQQNIPIAMAIVDLDNLKQVNDRLGHNIGDNYIRRAARMLKRCTSEKVTVCRIGGDEFAVIFEDAIQNMIDQFFDKVTLALSKQEASEPAIHISMGYAFKENSFGNMQQLYVEADQMMYEKKREKNIVSK